MRVGLSPANHLPDNAAISRASSAHPNPLQALFSECRCPVVASSENLFYRLNDVNAAGLILNGKLTRSAI